MLSFTDYRQQLLNLNKDYLINYKTPLDYTKLGNAHRFADLGFCLVEELLEFSEASTARDYALFDPRNDSTSVHYYSNVVKEAGDVLAFVTLLTDALGYTEELEQFIAGKLSVYPDSPPEMAHNLSRSFRQWFRKGVPVEANQIIQALASVLRVCDDHSITLAEIMQVNLDKLVSRFERDTLFTGAGDNR